MALSSDRDTPRRDGNRVTPGVGVGAKIYAGSLVMKNAAGYAVPGSEAAGCLGLGRANETVDNTAGQNGDLTVDVDKGVFRFKNSADADLITIADRGNDCFIVDDETVAKTSSNGDRSVAGKVFDVDAAGVWVKFE